MKNKKVYIGNVADINPRLSINNKPDSNELVSFVPMAAISEKTVSIENPVDRPYIEVSKGFTHFQKGDILIAKITPCFENGKMAYAKNLPRNLGFGSTEFHVLRPKGNIYGSYLFHLLRVPLIRRIGAKKMKGAAGQKRIPAEFFSSLQIPLPPLEEQKRIAKILDLADNLKTQRRQALAELDALLQSVFLDMFGDPVTNPKGWDTTTIGQIGQLGTGSTPSRLRDDYFKGSIPWVKSTEVDWGQIDYTSECVSSDGVSAARLKLYPKGSIVLALYGQGKTRGKCAILGVDATINQACCSIIPNRTCSTVFLFEFLKQSYFRLRGESRGGNQENLNMAIVRKFPIPLPPLELQRRFAAIVEQVEQQKARMREHLNELDTLFASLQHRAFNGEL